jgi:molybdopterin-binding protein
MSGSGKERAAPTALDLRLLAELESDPNLVRACARLGISRDRGIYRLQRLSAGGTGPLVRTMRGGRGAGSTTVTAAGRELLARARGPVLRVGAARAEPPAATILQGVWRGGRAPGLRLANGQILHAAFDAPPGATVDVAIDPEVVLVARRTFPTSARNVLAGTVITIRGEGPAARLLEVDVNGVQLRAGVTAESVRRLGLRPGARVVLYLKAVAVRPLAIRPRAAVRAR